MSKTETLLERRIRLNRPFTEMETLQFVTPLAARLRKLHATGRYHLRLRPENISIDEQGNVTIGNACNVDFPDATAPDTVWEELTKVKNKGFAAQEQRKWEPKAIGIWSDYYSLGAVLRSMLGQDMELGRKNELPEGTSPELANFINALMSGNPQKRMNAISSFSQTFPGVWPVTVEPYTAQTEAPATPVAPAQSMPPMPPQNPAPVPPVAPPRNPEPINPAQYIQPSAPTPPKTDGSKNMAMVFAFIGVAAVVIILILWSTVRSRNNRESQYQSEDNTEYSQYGDGQNGYDDSDYRSGFTIPASGDISQFDFLAERRLSDDELNQYTTDELRILRTAIYARHDYRFDSQDLLEYFGNFYNYTPRTKNVNLSETELHNVSLIKSHEH